MVLELLLVSAFVTFTLYVYFLLERLSFKGLSVYGLYSQAANTLVAFVTFGLLIDSFVRIVQCAKGDLAISKWQIFWQISSFFIFATAQTLLLVIFLRKQFKGVTGHQSATIESAEEFYLLISIELAELPLIHILNTLVA